MPSDWPFLPLISLYERTGGAGGGGDVGSESLPPGSVESVTHCLQWLLVLESWREGVLRVVPSAAKLARLCCLFLCSSDLFLERPVQRLGWGLLRTITHPAQLGALDLGVPLPGVASFEDLYEALLTQYEAVSFGDPLFGCVLLLPLQRRFSATMRLAVFGEHVGLLRCLGVSLRQVGLRGILASPIVPLLVCSICHLPLALASYSPNHLCCPCLPRLLFREMTWKPRSL